MKQRLVDNILNIVDFGKEKKSIKIFCLGDIHYGASECDETNLYKALEYVKRNKDIYILGMGDFLDFANKHCDFGAVHLQKITPQEQYDWLINLLKPFKGRIIGLHPGNHECRGVKEIGIEPIKMLSEALGCKYLGFGCFHEWHVGKNKYEAYTYHGHSGSSLFHTKLKSAMEVAKVCNCDIMASGHVHELGTHTTRTYEIVNGKVVERHKTFLLTGSWLNYWGTYAHQKHLVPGMIGNPLIELGGIDWKVDVNLNVQTLKNKK
jgi:predicted phosphodiesterase